MGSILFLTIGLIISADVQDTLLIDMDRRYGYVSYHTIERGETLYSLAKMYNIDVYDLQDANPQLMDQHLKVGSTLKVPVREHLIYYAIPDFFHRNQYIPLYYRVKEKDNLFKISKRYFSSSVESLRTLNKLENNILSIGQMLQIGWLKLNIETQSKQEPEASLTRLKIERPSRVLAPKQLYIRQEESGLVRYAQGVAMWKKNGALEKGSFVLHRKAAPNTIIKLINPMFNNSVYAKVLGEIPKGLYPPEIDVIVSSEVAAKLKVLDPHFFIRMAYMPASLTKDQ